MASPTIPKRRRSLLATLGMWLRNSAIVIGVAVLGAKLYADYRLEKQLDQLAGRVSPFGTLVIADSYAGFDGTLGIRSLSFIPDPELNAPPITVQEAQLNTPGFLWMLGFGRSSVPNSMGINLSGIQAELAGVIDDDGRSSISGLPVETLGCADISRFEPIDLNNMGFADQASNISGRYRIFPPEQIELQLVVENAGAAEVRMEMDLTVDNLLQFTQGLAPAEASLGNLSVSLQSSEFNRRRNSYCAAQSETESDAFVDTHVEAVLQDIANAGLTASDELKYQYRRFAEGDGTWSILARPDRPIPVAELASLGVPQLMQRLNLSGAIASGVPERIQLDAMVQPDVNEVTEVDETGQEVVRLTGPLRWQLVEVDNLGSYVGRDIRIDSRTGKQYTGRLVAITDGRVLIDTILPGGSAEIPIPLDQIFRVRLATRG
ncbi:MAG: hypothetical protein AAGA23_02750 [Pseudomonadota bacterium]